MIKLFLLFLLTTSTVTAKTLFIVDGWGQLAEYGDTDEPPRFNQMDKAKLAPGILLIKNLNCNKDCSFTYVSQTTKASGNLSNYILKNNLPKGEIIQHSNFGFDYFSIAVDYILNYKLGLMSTDFDSLFYNFFSNSSWRNYFKIKNLIKDNRDNKIIIFTTNHDLGKKQYLSILKENRISDYVIFIKDIKGEFLYKTPIVDENSVTYVHELELKNQFDIHNIKLKSWDALENLLLSNQGLSDSLKFYQIRNNENNNQIRKNREKQVDKKIGELYESLKDQYIINSKNQDLEE